MWDSQDLANMHAENAQDVAKHAQDVAKHAEDVRGRCQACLGVAKQAYTSQVPTATIQLLDIYRLVNTHTTQFGMLGASFKS